MSKNVKNVLIFIQLCSISSSWWMNSDNCISIEVFYWSCFFYAQNESRVPSYGHIFKSFKHRALICSSNEPIMRKFSQKLANRHVQPIHFRPCFVFTAWITEIHGEKDISIGCETETQCINFLTLVQLSHCSDSEKKNENE